MNKTREALDNLIAKVINTLISTKFWVLAVTMTIGALTALRSGGSWIEAVLGALMIISGGGIYSYTKYKQNIEYIRNMGEPQQKIPCVSYPKQPSLSLFSFGPPATTAVSPPVFDSEETSGIDWDLFLDDVTTRKEKLLREVPGKLESFAKYEAIFNAGRTYPADNTGDLYAFARMIYDAALEWWKDAAGFDYFEAIDKGVPEDFQNPVCPTKDLTLWIRTVNPAKYKPIVMAIRESASKLNTISNLGVGWQKRYPDELRTLTYVYSTI